MGDKRLFLALWPDDTSRRVIGACANQRLATAAGRAIPAANYHVTLRFLGATSAHVEQQLYDALDGMKLPHIALCFDRLSHWKTPNIACLESSQPDAALVSLAERLEELTQELGFTPEKHSYRPHITLAKKVADVASGPLDQPIRWQADELIVSQSKPTNGSVLYQPLRRFPLSHTAGYKLYLTE